MSDGQRWALFVVGIGLMVGGSYVLASVIPLRGVAGLWAFYWGTSVFSRAERRESVRDWATRVGRS